MAVGIFFVLIAAVVCGWVSVIYARRQRFADKSAADSSQQQVPLSFDEDLFAQAPTGLGQLALDGRIVRANRKLQDLCGFDEEQLSAYFLPNLLHSDDIGVINVSLNELAAGHGEAREMRTRLLHARGYSIWVHLAISVVRSRGRPLHLIAAITDVSEYMLAEQIAQSEHVKFAAMAAQVPVAVWLLSPEQQFVFANEAFETITGRTKESFFVNPRRFLELVHPDDMELVRKSVQEADNSSGYKINYRILRDDGDIRYLRQLGRNIYDAAGKLMYRITSATDISSEMIVRDELHALNSRLRETNLRLRESVRLDGLTHCLNRVALFEEAEKALLLARRYQRSSTVVFFDLNNFKEINDSFGHHIGDRALIAFADQIKARLRTTDELGRYGGDEFVALLRETDAEQAMQLLSTLPPVIVDNEDGSSIILRFSAGVACTDEPEIQSVDDWLRIADGMMYSQKTRLPRERGGRV